MKVILTGASGFLGKFIYNELVQKADVITISRTGADINLDLAKELPNLPAVNLVVHCAGKAHSVPRTDVEKKAFFDVNLTGTNNLLKGLDGVGSLPNSFVLISTVAVYGCDSGVMISEDHPLKAQDPYGQSKIEAEKLVTQWCNKNNVICTILRLPLLAGTNPPGNLGAMIKAISKGYYFNIAGGKAKKSIVLTTDIAKIISVVANIGGVYNLTDGYHPSFAELSNCIASQLNKRTPLDMPEIITKSVGLIGDMIGAGFVNSSKFKKMTNDLTFSDLKARNAFGWNPSDVLREFKI